MDHSFSNAPYVGPFAATLTAINAILAWIAIKDAQAVFAIVASCFAMASGFFAIRYYIKAYKKLN